MRSYLLLRGGDGFGETKERQGKVDEAILVVLDFGLFINDLRQ